MSDDANRQPRPTEPPRRPKSRPDPAELTREDRLKAALKANMARRKAQARARAAQDGQGRGNDAPDNDT